MYYGAEFTSKMIREWLERVGVTTLFIEPGSPWENGYNESPDAIGTQGRTIERGDLLLAQGGADTDRTVEAGVQHDPTSQLTWIPTTGA